MIPGLPQRALSKRIRAFLLRQNGGNVAVIFSLVAPVILLGMGATIDYTGAISSKRNLQTIADSAALGGAQATRSGESASAATTRSSKLEAARRTSLSTRNT